jgi:hypothetical protein
MCKIILFGVYLVFHAVSVYCNGEMITISILTCDDGNIIKEKIDYFSENKNYRTGKGIYYKIVGSVITKFYSEDWKSETVLFFIVGHEKGDDKDYIYAVSEDGEKIEIILFPSKHGIIIYYTNEILRIEEVLYIRDD